MRPPVIIPPWLFVTVEISSDQSEEDMLLFSLNTLFILIQKIKTFKPYNESLRTHIVHL